MNAFGWRDDFICHHAPHRLLIPWRSRGVQGDEPDRVPARRIRRRCRQPVKRRAFIGFLLLLSVLDLAVIFTLDGAATHVVVTQMGPLGAE